MAYSFSHNVISSQPPLLLFTICLTAFGITMVILAYVVGKQDLPNPDVLLDWNKLFKQLNQFKLCLNLRDSSGSRSTPETALNVSSSVVDQSKSLSAALSNVVHQSSESMDNDIRYTEVSAKIQLKLVGKPQPAFFKVNGKIKGNLLGFPGKYSSLLFNISLNFLYHGNTSCNDVACKTLWDVCIIMSIPSDLLSDIKFPEKCSDQIIPTSSRFQIFSLVIQDSYNSSCISMDYISDSKLTEMLSLHDRSIINLHLMHTSYFMFVMVMTLICFSLIKGKYRPHKNSHSLEKNLLDMDLMN